MSHVFVVNITLSKYSDRCKILLNIQNASLIYSRCLHNNFAFIYLRWIKLYQKYNHLSILMHFILPFKGKFSAL